MHNQFINLTKITHPKFNTWNACKYKLFGLRKVLYMYVYIYCALACNHNNSTIHTLLKQCIWVFIIVYILYLISKGKIHSHTQPMGVKWFRGVDVKSFGVCVCVCDMSHLVVCWPRHILNWVCVTDLRIVARVCFGMKHLAAELTLRGMIRRFTICTHCN